MIAALGVVVIAVGSGIGVYVYSRAHPRLQQPAARNGTAPTPATVGAQSEAQAQEAVLLTVVSSKPGDGASAIATSTPITLLFNLGVSPAAVQSVLSVRASDVNVPGQLSQGKTAQEVVFKPASSFSFGSSVLVTLRSGLKSVDGAALSNDYSFSFTTTAGPGSVIFTHDGNLARLVSATSGHPVTLSIQTGERVPSGAAIKTYRATAKDLLAALVYSKTPDGLSKYTDNAVDVSSMRLVDNGGTTMSASGARTTTLQNGIDVTISQPDGLYVIVAGDANGQYGDVWVDFSRYGVLVRQDDQRVVLAGQDLISGATTPSFNVTFYNLFNGVHAKLSGSFSGTGEFAAKYPAGLDIAIATSGGDEVAIPLAAPESGADVRISSDLSQQPQIFLTTDRPAYQKGETVKFGGVARLSNDQAYTIGGGTVSVWTMISANLAVAKVAADGTFSGSFKLPATEFATGGGDAVVTLFASASSANHLDRNALTASTSIIAVAPNTATNSLTVSLDKDDYFAGDSLVASITGLNANKQPLAGQTVSVGLYATQRRAQPVEMDSFPGASVWGNLIAPYVRLQFDAAGHATFRTTPKVGLKATDQEITVVAVNGSGKTQAFAARTAIFYQADDEAFLLAARSSFKPGETVFAPFVVESRLGARIAGMQLAYELVRTDYQGDRATSTVVASGTATTNANGLGSIRATYTGPPASLVLRVKGKDQAGRLFQDAKDITVDSVVDGNPQLDMTTDKIAYTVGDTAALTVTSPVAQRVLLSLERGRVHAYRWIELTKGDNQVSLNVTSDLAPGFSVVFTSMRNGLYGSEELPIYINNSSRRLKVTVTADQPTYTKGQIAHLSIAVADSTGAPVAASLLADGYEARMTSNLLEDQSSIAAAFLTPNRVGTNASSSLVSIGTWGDGMCGGGPPDVPQYVSGTYPGRSNVWLTSVATDASGHASIDVPMSLPGPVKLVVIANTTTSSWGQAEAVLVLQ